MIVKAIVCRKCKDAVFSRTRHDMRWCSCGSCAIDGGQGEGYIQITGQPDTYDLIPVEISQTKQELYDDWNTGKNKYGIIKRDEDQ